MSEERPRAASCFIIATRNRPQELLTTVKSLVEQSVLPSELCIADSSSEAPSRAVIEKLCAGAGLPLDYLHPAPRGLPRQRNLALARTSGDPVFLIDDDVYLEPTCHEQVLGEYERWDERLGGVRAGPLIPARPAWFSVLWRRLFGIGGWWPEASGRVRKGFWLEGTSYSSGVKKQEAFVGYFMSFRRAVFELESFDEALSGYASQEDIDFSYRVSRKWTLVQTPHARCEHYKTITDRLDSTKLERMKLANHFYLFKKNMPQDIRHRSALWWGLLGLFLHNAVKATARRDPGLALGIAIGAWEQARGRGLIDPATES